MKWLWYYAVHKRTHLESEHVMVPEENHGKENAAYSNLGGTILDTGNFQWGMNSSPTPDVWASLWVSGVEQLRICFQTHFQYSWSPLAETVTHQSYATITVSWYHFLGFQKIRLQICQIWQITKHNKNWVCKLYSFMIWKIIIKPHYLILVNMKYHVIQSMLFPGYEHSILPTF